MLRSGLGLVVVTRLAVLPLARWLAVATVVAAIGGVVLALWTLLLREQQVAANDLEAVQRWYSSQFVRARLVRLAGMLLVVGVLLAGLAGLSGLAAGASDRPIMAVVTGGGGAEQTARATVRWAGLPPGRLVAVSMIGVSGAGGQVLGRGVVSADADGTATVAIDAVKVNEASSVVLTAVAGTHSCAISLPLAAASTGPPGGRMSCQHS